MSKLGTVDDLVNDVTRAIKLAYGRGFQAGGLQMRKTILNAADGLSAPTHNEIAASIRHYGQRSSWGSVVAAMHTILSNEPSLTVPEIEERGKTSSRTSTSVRSVTSYADTKGRSTGATRRQTAGH